MIIPRATVRRALLICANHIASWPVNSWYCLGPKWDMNLFQIDGLARADICPVVDRTILSELSVSLLHFRINE